MIEVLSGDAVERLREMPGESVQCCVTSPPYWGLRDYSTNGQLGLEETPEEYVAKMVEIIELNPKYVALIEQRCDVTMGLALA